MKIPPLYSLCDFSQEFALQNSLVQELLSGIVNLNFSPYIGDIKLIN